MLLREYLDQGVSKREIASRLGVSRRTVHRWIRDGELDRDLDDEPLRYGPRPAVDRKIDGYKRIIVDRLEQYPALSAVRLFREVQRAGYEGGYTQIKDYVRSVRPRPKPDEVVRFETPPGHQAQVDFAHFRLPWGRRWALLVVLGYSRLLWLRFFARQDMEVLFRGLEEAFARFGGVPKEILFDQMRAVVVADHRLDGGPLIANPELSRFAHHWGFRPRACRPYRAKTKGKVERPIRYVRDSFFYGRDFVSDDDLNARAEVWLEQTANVRRHATLKERPIDRFEDERAALQPLAVKPYPRLAGRSQASPKRRLTPQVDVERRSLRDYSQLAGGGQ